MIKDQSRARPNEGASRDTSDALRVEIARLNGELRAFIAVALQHGLRDYCEARHPELTAELESAMSRSRRDAQHKYDQVLAGVCEVPNLTATTGDSAIRTYYRNAQDNVAYIEHALEKQRFVLGGIWVAPQYRGQGLAHDILRALVVAADDADLGIELYHDPFGEEGLRKDELEAFYNRHGFQRHDAAPSGMVRFPGTPLDLYARK